MGINAVQSVEKHMAQNMEFNWTDVEDIGVLREYTWELGGLINGAHLGDTVHDDETSCSVS